MKGPSGLVRWRLYAARENRFLFEGESEEGSAVNDVTDELEVLAQENIQNPEKGMLVRDGDEFRLEVFDVEGRIVSDDHYLFHVGIYASLVRC